MERYITTRKAAKMLGISISTVQRYFDDGTLAGNKNPITHRRKVSLHSVHELMSRHGMKY